jgi:serine/threonine protein kinase/tetratricopeptide (TPR) repeat protein
MMTAVFNRLGPYEILEEIGRGGMASVLLATDTRTNRRVALRLVSTREAPDVLNAERRGAELQEQFCRVSAFVPELYERGTLGGYLYVAMEYVDGENLSDVIRRGPLAPDRAVAIALELCRFLEDSRSFSWITEGREMRHLLHGDLTPANVRITSSGAVKVLDFGIAKALSLSRKVTVNDFGSVAYLSPERLESGGEMDATDGFWALGVMLYEMVSGEPPFRAATTRRLEQLILSRRPPPSLHERCPIGLQAVLAKLLGPAPGDRYESAQAIREDLERFQASAPTHAEQEGWPGRAADEPVTRRTRPAAEPQDDTTRRTRPPALPPPLPSRAATTPPPLPASARRSFRQRTRRVLRGVLLLIALVLVLKEISVGVSARRLADTVPARELDTLPQAWTELEKLSEQSLGPATIGLERSLIAHTTLLTDRVITKYRTGVSIVWEPEWRMARDALARAVAVSGQRSLRASLRYCQGHLHRINGDARREEKQAAAARQEFAEAVAAFREAAQLRSDWPDPFLGLARTFTLGLGDVDRGADALAQAERLGHKPGDRETVHLADGYRDRAESLVSTARQLAGMPQEQGYLERAVVAYRQALTLYGRIMSVGETTRIIRATQRSLERVEQRITELSQPVLAADLPPANIH